MKPGEIKYAFHLSTCVLCMVGDVRVNLSGEFDAFIESLLSQNEIDKLLIDLTNAEQLDSTTQGLLAKLALAWIDKTQEPPTVFSNQGDITLHLTSLGLDNYMHIVETSCTVTDGNEYCELKPIEETEEAFMNRLTEAHQILSNINKHNNHLFKDLLNTIGK